MAKLNPMVQIATLKREIVRLEGIIAQMKFDSDYLKGFTIQQSLDVAQITLGDEFGFGPDRQAKFEKAFKDTFVECCQICVDDGKSDDDLSYTKAVMDRKLKVCRGTVLPFDERYAMERLYFRDRDLKETK